MNSSSSRRLGICMIVRDDEVNLPDILPDAKSFIGEIAVVDQGASDTFGDFAPEAGAVVIEQAPS